MSDEDAKDGQVIPPRVPSLRSKRDVSKARSVDNMPTGNPSGIVGAAVTRFVAGLRRKANAELAADAHARADYFDAVGRAAKSYIGMNQDVSVVAELDEIIANDQKERAEQRAEQGREREHRKAVAEHRRRQELIEAQRGAFNAEQGYENQKRLNELNLEIWQKRKEAEHLDAAAMADHLRGDSGGGPKRGDGGLLSELQAQTDKLEKEILEGEADGTDTGGDRMALSELKALIERLRGR